MLRRAECTSRDWRTVRRRRNHRCSPCRYSSMCSCRLEAAERGSRSAYRWESAKRVVVPEEGTDLLSSENGSVPLARAPRRGDELAEAREVFPELLADALV